MRLVDHQQPAGRRQPRQHLVAEAGVVQPLGRDEQHVDLAGRDLLVDRLPLLGVRGVDGHRPDAGPLGGRDLVAHQRQQRRDDHRRPGALLAQQQGGHEVHRRLAPAGPLHHERAALVDRERRDRRPLVVVQHGIVPADQRPQVRLGALAGVGGGAGRHADMSTRGRGRAVAPSTEVCLPLTGSRHLARWRSRARPTRSEAYQIRTRSSGSSQRPSASEVPNAVWNSSRLRTMLARNSGGLCGSMVRYWSAVSLRRLVRQQ